ncbi:MAG: hypothetical protein OXH09_15260 [Gammaproteobacteria bacterium]|nr:hypothetical protein [Gammaproteobacteria bacterium]
MNSVAHAVDPVRVSAETDCRLRRELFLVSRQSFIVALAMSVLLSTYSPATERQSLPEGFSLADPVWLLLPHRPAIRDAG